MPRRFSPHTVLVASRDPQLADVRKAILEDAGYRVVTASTIAAVAKGCKENNINLVLIGYSVRPSDKRRMFLEAREHCKTPVLELYSDEAPHLVSETRTFQHHAETPHDFLQAVSNILRRR